MADSMYPMTANPPEWTRWALRLAGLYHFAAAGWLLHRMPECALLWAALGVGFWCASGHAYRHWSVVLTGFTAKFAAVLAAFWVPWPAVADGVAWAPVFATILYGAHEALLQMRRTVSSEVLRYALRRKTQYGLTLEEHSKLTPVLLVFLRHSGCMFCREALSDLARMQNGIEEEGARLVLVHMGRESNTGDFFDRYGLENVPRISDPDRALYRAFALNRGSVADVFGPRVWWRGLQLLTRYGVGRPAGDGFQMPGAFLLFHGEIVRTYRHQSPADRPDYLGLVTGRDYAAPELRDL